MKGPAGPSAAPVELGKAASIGETAQQKPPEVQPSEVPAAPITRPSAPPKATSGHQPIRSSRASRPIAVEIKQRGRHKVDRETQRGAEQLLSRRLRAEVTRAFGSEAAGAFELPTSLAEISAGGKPPRDLAKAIDRVLRALADGSGPADERRLPQAVINQVHQARVELMALSDRLLAEGATPELISQMSGILGAVLPQAAEARGVYMMPVAKEVEGFVTFRAMRPKERELEALKDTDPEAYAALIRRRQTYREFEANVQDICRREGFETKKARILGLLVTVATDPRTKEEIAYTPQYGAQPIAELIETRKRELEARRKLQQEPEQLEVRAEDLERVPDSVLSQLQGEKIHAALTDDQAKDQALTRIFAVREHEGRQVVVEGRWKGCYLDELVNASGRLIEGVAHDYDPASGRASTSFPRPDVADREPYTTAIQVKERGAIKEKLLLQLPNKRGEWTELRQAMRKLADQVPSIKYQEGSRNTAFVFEPKDFAAVRDTLQGMSLSTGALNLLRGYFRDLAEADRAIAHENLGAFELGTIGGFKRAIIDADGNQRPVELSTKQLQAVAWLEANGHRGVCALDTGMGKTLTSLAVMQKLIRDGIADGEGANGRFLFVCPRAQRGNLIKEIHRFMDKDSAKALLARLDIVSYGEFRSASESGRLKGKPFRPQRYGAVFFDEAQELKNPSTKTSRAALALNHPRKICLTASPMEKTPLEAYVLSAVASGIDLGDREAGKTHRAEMRKFKERFTETFGGRILGVKQDAIAQRDLHAWVKRNIFYADKVDLPEAPLIPLDPKHEAVPMSEDVATAYRIASAELKEALAGMVSLYRDKGLTGGAPNPAAKHQDIPRILGVGLASALKKLYDLQNMPEKVIPGAGYPKLDRFAEFFDQTLAKSPKSRPVLFAEDREMVLKSAEELSRKYPADIHAAALAGEIVLFKNGERLERFGDHPQPFRERPYRRDPNAPADRATNRQYQTREWQQFVLGELLSGSSEVRSLSLHGPTYSTGQNLQAFDLVVQLDRNSWTSEDMKQRTARVWRQGQDKPVVELTLDATFAEPDGSLDATLDQIRALQQKVEGDLFDKMIKAAQSFDLTEGWVDTLKDASIVQLDRDTMSLMISPDPSRARPRGERDVAVEA